MASIAQRDIQEGFKPFAVNIKDASRKTDVCLCVDNPRIIKFILKLRIRLGIKKLLPIRIVFPWKSQLGHFLNLTPDKIGKLENDIKDYLGSIGFSPAFVPTCIAAAVSNMITDPFYRRAYAEEELIPNPYLTDNSKNNPMVEDRMVIVVHPGATKEEIVKAFKEIQNGFAYSRNKLNSTDKRIDFEHFFTVNLSQYGGEKGIKTKWQIDQIREWYWQHESGMSYEDIARKHASKNGIDAIDVLSNVKKSVKHYSILLGKSSSTYSSRE